MRIVPLIVGVLLVGGCSAPGLPVPPDQSSGTTTSSAPAPVADPTAVSIPSLDVRSELIPLGLTVAGELDVPPLDRPELTSWYAGEDVEFPGDEFAPGENGPAILAAHVDGYGPDGSKGFPGAFARLDELAVGAEVFVDQADGGQLRFVVDRVETYAKAALPWGEIMAETRGPELRLITCGGAFDRASGHYVDNVVAFASLAT